MNEAIDYINVLPATGAESDLFARKVIEAVGNGTVNPLKLLVQLKAIENTIKAITESNSVRESFVKEWEKYGQKEVEDYHAVVSVYSVKNYEYKDAVLDDLEKQLEQLKKVIKARQETLKSGVDPSTGEEFKVKVTESPRIKITIK